MNKAKIEAALIKIALTASVIAGITLFILGVERVMASDIKTPVAGFLDAMNSIDYSVEVEEPQIVFCDEGQAEEVDVYEVDLLARLIYCEAGTCSDTALYFVGSVALNRVNSSLYPNDLYSVVYQRGQYAVTWDGSLKSKTPDQRARDIARDLLVNGSRLPADVLGQASFVPKGWALYTEVDNIKFSAYRR